MSTFSYPLRGQFQLDYAGQAANVGFRVVDAAGTLRLTVTTGVTEALDRAGDPAAIYEATATLDTAWAYPLDVYCDIAGVAGVEAHSVVGAPAAPQFRLACENAGNAAPGDLVRFTLSVSNAQGQVNADTLPVPAVSVNGMADPPTTAAVVVNNTQTGLYEIDVQTFSLAPDGGGVQAGSNQTAYNYSDNVGLTVSVVVGGVPYVVNGGFSLSGTALSAKEHQQIEEDDRVAMEAAPDSTPLPGSPDDLLSTIADAITGAGGVTDTLEVLQQTLTAIQGGQGAGGASSGPATTVTLFDAPGPDEVIIVNPGGTLTRTVYSYPLGAFALDALPDVTYTSDQPLYNSGVMVGTSTPGTDAAGRPCVSCVYPVPTNDASGTVFAGTVLAAKFHFVSQGNPYYPLGEVQVGWASYNPSGGGNDWDIAFGPPVTDIKGAGAVLSSVGNNKVFIPLSYCLGEDDSDQSTQLTLTPPQIALYTGELASAAFLPGAWGQSDITGAQVNYATLAIPDGTLPAGARGVFVAVRVNGQVLGGPGWILPVE